MGNADNDAAKEAARGWEASAKAKQKKIVQLVKDTTRFRAELQWIANAYPLEDKETTYRTRVLILRARKALS